MLDCCRCGMTARGRPERREMKVKVQSAADKSLEERYRKKVSDKVAAKMMSTIDGVLKSTYMPAITKALSSSPMYYSTTAAAGIMTYEEAMRMMTGGVPAPYAFPPDVYEGSSGVAESAVFGVAKVRLPSTELDLLNNMLTITDKVVHLDVVPGGYTDPLAAKKVGVAHASGLRQYIEIPMSVMMDSKVPHPGLLYVAKVLNEGGGEVVSPNPATAYIDEHLLCTHDGGAPKKKIDCKQHYEEAEQWLSQHQETSAPSVTTPATNTVRPARPSRARSTSASAGTTRSGHRPHKHTVWRPRCKQCDKDIKRGVLTK